MAVGWRGTGHAWGGMICHAQRPARDGGRSRRDDTLPPNAKQRATWGTLAVCLFRSQNRGARI